MMYRSKHIRYLFVPLVFLFILFSACQKEQSLKQSLYKASNNKIYKHLDEAKLASTIEKVISEDKSQLNEAAFIADYYKNNGFQAVLLKRYLPNDELSTLIDYLKDANTHGLDPAVFNIQKYEVQVKQILGADNINNIDEAYTAIAKLEVQTADKLIHYSNVLEYGLIDPTKIFQRYYLEVKRPDSSSMKDAINAQNLKLYLDSIQPSSKDYKTLQRALLSSTTLPGKSEEESKKIIQANLERLRWKHDYDSSNMVYVNIPAFKLELIKGGKLVEEMKVVVGTGRNMSGEDEISKHGNIVKDSPHARETPMLTSLIHSVQVNPVWNIPESIASKEIINQVRNDPFYLVNNGIEVLQNEKVVEDPMSIDWSSVSKENLPYRFRQKPGDDNALGKIKFLFDNNSSVYLHDTPAQAAFQRDVRASSHGCVRVENPEGLARFVFDNNEKFQTVKSEMEGDNKQAKTIALDPKMTVVLDYQTLVTKDDKIQYFPDIYGLDIVLFTHMM